MSVSRRLVALTRELPGDLDTPVGVYLRLANRPYSYLLESVQGGERWGRYSFIGLPCRERIEIRGEVGLRWVGDRCVARERLDDPLGWLRAQVTGWQVPAVEGLPRFAGGHVGYVGYDAVRWFEPRIRGVKPDPIGTPDVLLMRSEELAVFDNLRATLTLVVHADPDDPQDLARARRRLDEMEAELAAPVSLPHAPLEADCPLPAFSTTTDREAFCASVQRVRDYIAAGDCMQVVLSQRLTAPFDADPVALYRALRRMNPSPYLYCMHLGDHHVVGSSPEILVHVQDGEMAVRPIAGTRPRGATPEADRALEAELLADPKERAEHLMLIDLGRNDVGRVCEIGSVRLAETMVVERYSHVMHLVSQVCGRLRPGLDALDALAAAFPAGTLTGAPKVRAMEIIDELEPVRRGVYGGAVGYIGWGGNLDMAIAIRTAVIKGGLLHVQAGAGVVADSVPEREWEETLNKAQAVMRAAGQGLAATRR